MWAAAVQGERSGAADLSAPCDPINVRFLISTTALKRHLSTKGWKKFYFATEPQSLNGARTSVCSLVYEGLSSSSESPFFIEMEVLPEGKNFKLIEESELPEILDFLAKYLPESIKFHQTLKTYLNDRVWDFYFYITKSWPEEPVILHFPGMTKTPNGKIYESFSVFCPCDRLECLDLLENEDVLIDWTQPIYLNFTHGLIMEKIEHFYSVKGTIEKLVGDVYILSEPPPGNEFENIETEIAEDAEMLQLSPEHALTIHDLYPANQMESIEIFEKLIGKLPSYGIFSVNGELAAWMVQSYYGAMFSMQTKPEFRRKGYGIYLAKYLTKVVLDRGYLPFVVIRPENDASKSLYAKLGFKKHFETVRAVLLPRDIMAVTDGQDGGTPDP